jgi:hypothetical protein
MKHVTFFLFVFVECASQRTNVIYLEVSPAKLILNQKLIAKSDFERHLKITINRKIDEGFKRDELVKDIKINARTRRGDIADIEKSHENA